MSEDRAHDATANEDGGERDGGDEKIIGPTENRRGWWRSNNAIESRGKRRIF